MSKLSRWMPREELEWDPNRSDGSGKARIECEQGVVDLFTYPGDDRHRAFTQLRIWIHPYRYQLTHARHYHPNWWRRISREFAAHCVEEFA